MARSTRPSTTRGQPKGAKERPKPGEGEQASTEEFDREGMGVAAKE